METRYFTLKEYMDAVDNAYATGKANATKEEKEAMIEHIKTSAKNWTVICDQNENQSKLDG